MELLPSGGAVHLRGPAPTQGRAGQPILFLHGLGGGAWSWEPQAQALSERHPCYVWEARGHGAAQAVDDAGVADYYTDASEALGLVLERERRPAVIAGHSLGGYLAIVLAAEVAAAVEGLFLVDPFYTERSSLARPWLGPFMPLARLFYGIAVASIRRGDRPAQWILQRAFSRSFEDRAAFERAWEHQRLQIPFDYPRLFFDAFDGPAKFAVRPFLDEITVPVMLLEARRKKTLVVPLLAEALRVRLGAAFTHEILPGGHYLQLDQAAAVSDRLAAFLTTVSHRG